jgi:hypothetical protein
MPKNERFGIQQLDGYVASEHTVLRHDSDGSGSGVK